MVFANPADPRVKLNESENQNKYLDFARKLKKKTMEHVNDGDTNGNWHARSLNRGVIERLEDMEIRGRVEVIYNTVLPRSARILRRVPET